MAIFSRMVDLIKANINDLIDKAEDPEKMIKQIIVDMEEQLQQATQGLGQVMASQRQLAKQLEAAQQESKLWEDRAKKALQSGDQELARQAVERKLKADQNVKQYETMHAEVAAQVDTVREQVTLLKGKLDEARAKQTMLLARDQVADARLNVAKAVGGLDSSGAFAKMDKMEQKIAEKEAHADAIGDISGMDDAKEDPFAKMEQQSAADAEMARLMAEMKKD